MAEDALELDVDDDLLAALEELGDDDLVEDVGASTPAAPAPAAAQPGKSTGSINGMVSAAANVAKQSSRACGSAGPQASHAAAPQATVHTPSVANPLKKAPRQSHMSAEQEEEMRKKDLERLAANPPSNKPVEECYSGIHLSAREVDKQQLEDAMKTRWPVRLKTLTDFINAGKHDKQDFVVFGVLSEKGADRMNKKDKRYAMWTLDDLDSRSQRVLMTEEALDVHDAKVKVGTLVGILNPEADFKTHLLTVDSGSKLLPIGTAAFFAFCKGRRKDGLNCSMVVNTEKCEYCQYHVKSGVRDATGKRQTLNAMPSRQPVTKQAPGTFTMGRRSATVTTASKRAAALADVEPKPREEPRSALTLGPAHGDGSGSRNDENSSDGPRVKVIRKEEVSSALRSSRFGAKHLRAEDSKVAPADPIRFADQHIVRTFGHDPISKRSQREILIATSNNSSLDAKSFLRVDTHPKTISLDDFDDGAGKAKAKSHKPDGAGQRSHLEDLGLERDAAQRKRKLQRGTGGSRAAPRNHSPVRARPPGSPKKAATAVVAEGRSSGSAGKRSADAAASETHRDRAGAEAKSSAPSRAASASLSQPGQKASPAGPRRSAESVQRRSHGADSRPTESCAAATSPTSANDEPSVTAAATPATAPSPGPQERTPAASPSEPPAAAQHTTTVPPGETTATTVSGASADSSAADEALLDAAVADEMAALSQLPLDELWGDDDDDVVSAPADSVSMAPRQPSAEPSGPASSAANADGACGPKPASAAFGTSPRPSSTTQPHGNGKGAVLTPKESSTGSASKRPREAAWEAAPDVDIPIPKASSSGSARSILLGATTPATQQQAKKPRAEDSSGGKQPQPQRRSVDPSAAVHGSEDARKRKAQPSDAGAHTAQHMSKKTKGDTPGGQTRAADAQNRHRQPTPSSHRSGSSHTTSSSVPAKAQDALIELVRPQHQELARKLGGPIAAPNPNSLGPSLSRARSAQPSGRPSSTASTSAKGSSSAGTSTDKTAKSKPELEALVATSTQTKHSRDFSSSGAAIPTGYRGPGVGGGGGGKKSAPEAAAAGAGGAKPGEPPAPVFGQIDPAEAERLRQESAKYLQMAHQSELRDMIKANAADIVRDQCQRKMEETTERKVKAWHCGDCKRFYTGPQDTCKEDDHEGEWKQNVPQRFFTCNECSKHFSTLGEKYPTKCRRRGCKSGSFKKSGMVREAKADMPKIQARGEEHGKFLGSRPGGGFERVSDSLDDD